MTLQSLVKAIADMSVRAVSPEQIDEISGHLDNWNDVGFEDKRNVLDTMATVINTTSDVVDICWKF